jgi:hypothetical protein
MFASLATALASLLAVEPPPPPLVAALPPAPLPLTVSLDLETAWRLDRNYQLFSSSRDASRGGITVSYDVTRPPYGPRLALGLGFHGESSDGTWTAPGTAGSGTAGLEVQTGSLSGILRWPLRSWLEPHLRAAADLSHGGLHVRVGSDALQGSAWSVGASAGAGFRLRTTPVRLLALPGDGLFAFAGVIEGGFHVGQPLSFALARDTPAVSVDGSDDRLPPAATPAGSLGRSYPYLRLSAAMLF